MKKQPIHQNLNTSFVNVGALVRYLRQLQFVGSIRVELSSYEADIIFTSSMTIRAREYDHIAGRISQGEQALKRILIRCKEPHGKIDVYKAAEGYAGADESVFVDKAIIVDAREMAASTGGTAATEKGFEFVLSEYDSENALVLAALSEILRKVERALAQGNLSFTSAFQLSCDSIAAAYPFMEKNRHAMIYKKGEIRLSVPAKAASVTSAVFDALRPIFQRLRGEQKYELLFRTLTDDLRESAAERRTEYVRLGLMKYIEDLLAD
jgi:hypothetical protein